MSEKRKEITNLNNLPPENTEDIEVDGKGAADHSTASDSTNVAISNAEGRMTDKSTNETTVKSSLETMNKLPIEENIPESPKESAEKRATIEEKGEEKKEKEGKEGKREEGKIDIEEKPSLLYWIPAAIIFMILSLLPAWKILPRINTHYIGGGELEGWLWRYWWFKQLISSLMAQNPKDWSFILYTYFCAGNFPETGNVFDWQTFSLILEPIFGDPAYYNIKVILILFLNGLAGYALAKYLTKNPITSILGGAILILNPYVAYELANGRPRQAMLFSMPLFVMYLIDNYRTLSLKSGLLAGFWLGISGAMYLFYGMASLFFGLIFIIVQLFIDHRKFTFAFVKYIIVMLSIFVLISGPFSFRYIELVMKREKLPEVLYKTDFPPLSFLLQDPRNVDPRNPLAQSILRYRTDSAPLLYPFYLTYAINIPIVITLLALVPLLFRRPVPWLWIIVFFVFYLLSLGPYLRHGLQADNYVRIASGRPIPLLYAFFFKYVPFFSRLFAPIRMMGMMYVALIALVMTNLKYLLDLLQIKLKPIFNLNYKLTSGIVTFLLIFAIAFQMIKAEQIPIAPTEISYPDIYDDIAKEQGNIGIIEVPFRVGDFANYYQMYHGKKVLWGWTVGSIPQGFPESRAKFLAAADYIQTNTFVSFLEDLNRQPTKPRAFQPADLEKLRDLGYRYVILHERGCYEIDPEHADLLYEYFVYHLSKALGEPIKVGTEKLKWQMLSTHNPDKQFRVAVFKIR